MKMAFIGGGKMAEAILHGVLSGKLADPDDISVGEPVAERREYLVTQFGIRTNADNLKTAGSRSCSVCRKTSGSKFGHGTDERLPKF